MAYGSTKKFDMAKTKRITSLPCANLGKKARINAHFSFVHDLKNEISDFIYTHRFKLLNNESKKHLKTLYKRFNNDQMRAWEVQKIFQTTMDFYENSLKKQFQNNTFQVQKTFKIIRYKKIVRNKNKEIIRQKGDLKNKELIKKNTPLTNIMNWLLYIEESELDNASKWIPSDKAQPVIDKAVHFNHELTRWRKTPYWTRIKNVIKARKKRLLNKIKRIEYQNGTYTKLALDGKTPCSRFYIDESNKEFKHWYVFKMGKDEVHLPMAFNQTFHDEDFDVNGAHFVKLNDKGRLNIGLLYHTARPYEIAKTINSKNLVGIDLNVASNFCSIAYHDREELKDYDRSYVQKVVEKLQSLEKDGYQHHTQNQDKALKKLLKGVEFYFKSFISTILYELKDQGITDIVLEDLDLTKISASHVKDEKLNIKYSKLIRMLRLSSIKEWMKNQANNLGIRVHLTSPCYTSQMCSSCGHISPKNRKGRYFKCEMCDHQEDADKNAAKNIRQRIIINVLLKNLHELENGQLKPKKLRKESIRKVLTDYILKADNERQHLDMAFKKETTSIIQLV